MVAIIDRYTVEFTWFGLGVFIIGFLNSLMTGLVSLPLLAGMVVCLVFWRVRTKILFEGDLLISRELIWLFIGLLIMNLVEHLTQARYFWAALDAAFIWLNWNNWKASWQ